ncbi:hypothetical protein C8J56DRAFT_184355 [Mycena floridula]|nr:hypothetical protein C8J56DRAFT_184355 [Mycena floridula]
MATDVPIFAQGILHPSGLIWAEKRDYFFPWGDNEIWSRSMIDSDNGVVEGVVWDVPESQPRVVPPFSLLEFRQNPVCQNTTMTRVAAEPPETEIILSSPCSQSEELDTKHSPIASVMSWTIVDAPNSPSDRISLSSAIYVRDGSSPLNPIHVSAKNQSIHGLSVEDSLEHVPQSMIYPSASASSLPASLHDTGLSPSPAAACEALSDKVPATTDLIISEKASDEPIPKATLDEALVLTDNLEVSKKASNEVLVSLQIDWSLKFPLADSQTRRNHSRRPSPRDSTSR